MSIDFDRLRKDRDAQKKGGREGYISFERDGKKKIRIAPPKTEGELFYKAFGWHNDIGVCLKTFGKNCPACDYVGKLFQIGTKPIEEVARQFYRKKHYLVNAIDRTELDKGVQIWEFKTQVYDQVIPKFLGEKPVDDDDDDDENFQKDDDAKQLDLTDPKEGYDLIVKTPGVEGQKWFNYKISDKLIGPCPLGVKGWRDKLKDLDEEVQNRVVNPEDMADLMVTTISTFAESKGVELPSMGKKKKSKHVEEEDEDIDEIEDDEDEEDTSSKKKTAKKSSKSDEDDEDEELELEDDEDEEEEDEKPKKKKKSKSSDDEDEEEDEEEESEDDDEVVEKTLAKRRDKLKGKKKPKSKKNEDEDEEDELEDDDE